MLSCYSSISQANLILDNLGGQSSSLSGLFFLQMCTISNKKEPGQSKHLQRLLVLLLRPGEKWSVAVLRIPSYNLRNNNCFW